MISHEEPMQRVRRTPSDARAPREDAGPRLGGSRQDRGREGRFLRWCVRSRSRSRRARVRKREATRRGERWGRLERPFFMCSVASVLLGRGLSGYLSVWVFSYFMGWRECMANGNNCKEKRSVEGIRSIIKKGRTSSKLWFHFFFIVLLV
jgi:hypothetical protein